METQIKPNALKTGRHNPPYAATANVASDLNKTDDLSTLFQHFHFRRLDDLLASLASYAGKKSFLIFKNNKYINVLTDNIAFFYVKYESSMIASFDRQEYFVNYSLEQIQNLLAEKQFFRINRQYLINFKAIKEVEHYFARKLLVNLVVPSKDKLLVSKQKVSAFLDWLSRQVNPVFRSPKSLFPDSFSPYGMYGSWSWLAFRNIFEWHFQIFKNSIMEKKKNIIASTIITGAVLAASGLSAGAQVKDEIRPFHIKVPQTTLDDLRSRVLATKWPEQETVRDQSQGVQLATMKKLADYWGKDYDWRKIEAKLNAIPQFVTTIDGLDIHFLHVRSKHKNALPVIITHGWPGSVIEQMKIIGPLTDPTAFGGKAEDAFDVVIPSLPGHGFSGKPGATGWDPIHIARAWIVLMKRLGYTRYVAQGGDWGNAVTEQMALLTPSELVGIHTNMPATLPDEISKALQFGTAPPSGLAGEEKSAWDQLDNFYKHGLGYAQEMANRPQTLYGIADSPIGLAAWMLDHDASSLALIARVFDGQSEGLTRDDILDNITLYWITNTAVSSARLYWESKLAFFAPKHVEVPTAVSVYPDEIYSAPKSWTVLAYPKLIYYNRLPKGGHFAAWEQPKSFSEELRAAFKSLR